MPLPLLNAHVTEMPRISAEESLLAVQRGAIGSGVMGKGDRRRVLRAWEQQAGHKRSALRPKGKAMYEAQLGAIGIGLKVEGRDGEA